MPSLILAFDIGTSSTRSALFDLDGRRLPQTLAQQNYPLLTSGDGAAEIEPETLLKAVRNCLAKTMAARRAERKLRTQTIRAVGVSCFWHSLIGCDTRGVPLTPVITWADARCRSDAARLRAEMSERDAHARTGCMLRSSFWPAKVAWLRRTRPALFRRMKIWMSPAEWAQQQLVGEATCAIGMATGTGILDPRKLDWDDALLDHLHLRRAHLKPLSDEPAIIGAPLAARFPELRGVPWFPAIGDGAASNLGCGATVPGLAAMNVGTSAALRLMRRGKNASAPFGLFCYRIDADRYLVGGAASNAGNLRAWCCRELKIPDEPGIDQLLAMRPGPVASLTVLPFWTAERAPTWNEDETGLIHGVTQHTSALDLFQAITDAGYHRLRQIGDLLLGKNAPPVKFIVSGGIHKSLVAVQRLADVTGFVLYPSDEPEASLRGAAIYALEKIGAKIAHGEVGAAIRPRPRWAREHARQREKQIALEEMLKSRALAASPSRR